MRILAAYAYFTANCLAAFRSHHEYPFATCLLVESTARHEHSIFWLAELKIEVIGLAAADVVRSLPFELEIRLELSVTHLRIDLADNGSVGVVLPLECRGKSS